MRYVVAAAITVVLFAATMILVKRWKDSSSHPLPIIPLFGSARFLVREIER